MSEAVRSAIRAWTDRAESDPRIKACWLEGPTPQAIRARRAPVALHIGVEEPDFSGFVEELEAFVGAGGPIQRHQAGPADPDAWATTADLEGVGQVVCTLERMSLIGKRPRAAVHPLVDRVGQLRHVCDYSAAAPSRPARPKGGRRMPSHPELLSDAAISAGLGALRDWHRQGNELIATFTMPSFLSGVSLVGEVALAAEHANHHPNILIRYRTIAFSLSTHEAGGITQRDLDLATEIDALALAIESGKKPKAPGKKKAKAQSKSKSKSKSKKTGNKKAPAKKKVKAKKKVAAKPKKTKKTKKKTPAKKNAKKKKKGARR